ncbi:MAG TPA: copper-binding protein, partial [Isosphaeraceae bacterium]|nr:copper-binding protein [Isosphaeraceae bacterium]
MRPLWPTFSIPMFVGLGLLVSGGCQPSKPQAPKTLHPTLSKGEAATSQEQTKDYRLVGTVVEVDPKALEIKIKHEAIPGYMPAMTMSFPIKKPELLEDLHAGDEV